MATPVKFQTRSDVATLRQEVRQLRSLVISLVGQDREGRYRPAFVREVLRSARQKPQHVFRDARTFLEQLRRA